MTIEMHLNSVCYGNGLYVAVGGEGGVAEVVTSPDGINWTSHTAPSGNWNAVCYGNGLFVAVGDAGRIMTSSDGITWTLRTGATSKDLQSVCYGNGLFVAVALPTAEYSKLVVTSSDGVTWIERMNPIVEGYWQSVCYGSGQFVAVSGGEIMGPNAFRVMTSGIDFY